MSTLKRLFKKFLGFEDEELEDDDLTEEYAEELKIPENDYVRHEKRIYRSDEITLYPKSFSDACVIVEHLEAGNIVTIDLSNTDIETSKRITDFVLGAIYALNGDVEKISRKVFRFWLN